MTCSVSAEVRNKTLQLTWARYCSLHASAVSPAAMLFSSDPRLDERVDLPPAAQIEIAYAEICVVGCSEAGA